ncbi:MULTISPECIES: adenylate/guanylate cyclase domain-containing protein [Protofrankia]|uniref:Adenylate/guanylate cyclase n=1 Tax=Candidatus Protofrankia datiscae TaxID=2716812 RepID=F8B028_9ACTN|nr:MULTISPECIES: adenylate/guanylate cyclase domain-containing protein [Protofrankia]AEH11725.1 adenylate/guanylate cyclase [Candidatus Protofrankia datiscae]
MVACPTCGKANQEEARFCFSCGTPQPTFGIGARKTVTILFCDVTGYTAIGEQIDSEPLQQVMWRFFSAAREVISSHGGSVEKFIGDAVFAVFGIPVLHEDDALRAARAACGIRASMDVLNADLERDWGFRFRIRIGINTGEVTVGGPGTGGGITGDAVNVASRLEEAAAPGEIFIADATLRLIRPHVRAEPVGPLVVQGKKAPLRAHRLIDLAHPGIGPGARFAPEGFAAPVIGRERERRRLDDALEQVIEERTCHLFTLLGPAGIGKSRMVREFCEAMAPRATVLTGRCLSYGEGITYWPLMEMVRQATGMSADESAPEGRRRLRELLDEGGSVTGDAAAVVDGLAPLVGLGGAEVGAQESFWAVRTFLAALAEKRPLIVWFDDVHWAEPTLLDLIEHVADWSREAPILLLCLTRPELLEERRTWGGGKLNTTSMLLQPLSEERCQRLIRTLMGSNDLDPELVARITDSAAGNPLFVEQTLAALVDDGLLRREGDHWIATDNLGSVQVAPTISALLAARLDRLNIHERRVLERAAVVGQRFYLDAVVELSAPADRAAVAEHCLSLVRKELVHPDRSDLPGVEAFRFLHVLLRDCAYQATSKRQRADLHQGYASWLQTRMAGRPGEHDELVGYHLEQAYRYRVELGLRDAETEELGRQAATCLIEAADRVRQGDETGAAGLLKRAVKLLPVTDPLRIRAEIDLGWALYSFGRFSDAERMLRQATDRATRIGEAGLRAHARLAHLRLMFATSPEGLVAETLGEATRALPIFVQSGDEVGAALACRSQAAAYMAAGCYALAERAMQAAVRHAEESGVLRDVQTTRRDLVHLLSLAPRPVGESIERAQRALAGVGDDRGLRRSLLAQLALLHTMAGELDAGMDHLARAEAIDWDVRSPRGDPLYGGFVVARIALLTDDLDTAEHELRRSCRRLARMGERAHLATRAAALADVLVKLGRLDEATTYVSRSRDAAAGDQVPAQAGWCGVHAKLLAMRGRDREVEAVRFAEAACDLAGRTDDWDGQAQAWLTYAEVLHRTGQTDLVRPKVDAAVTCYEKKGNLTGAAQARRLSENLTASV